jgi:hypothetical protein
VLPSDLRMRRRDTQIILATVVAGNGDRYRGSVDGRSQRQAPAGLLHRALAFAKVDGPRPHRQPATARLVVAIVGALTGSFAADALLVAIANLVFPSTKGYVHFRFADYGKLTAVGVLVACLAWPIVTWISSAPRWLFFRLAVLVTLVLWLPDLWILSKGQPFDGVLGLMLMHVAIALITYNLLVRVAPPRQPRSRGADRDGAPALADTVRSREMNGGRHEDRSEATRPIGS